MVRDSQDYAAHVRLLIVMQVILEEKIIIVDPIIAFVLHSAALPVRVS